MAEKFYGSGNPDFMANWFYGKSGDNVLYVNNLSLSLRLST